MGFLDNSGDIILDAVLTDAGRARLAKGDGSFKISKFALGDDEINYKLYDSERSPPDANILSTPIFEAFTNNISSLNSRLLTVTGMNNKYMPVMLINNLFTPSNKFANTSLVQNGYILAVDKDTEDFLQTAGLRYLSQTAVEGILNGSSLQAGSYIRVDQGINNSALPPTTSLQNNLKETQYLIEIDNRFASIASMDGRQLNYSYIDDDYMTSYYVSLDDDSMTVKENTVTDEDGGTQVIAGSRGTYLNFKLKSSIEMTTSNYLFERYGKDITNGFTDITPLPTNVKKISTYVRVTGLTTGYAIDVPLALIKKIS